MSTITTSEVSAKFNPVVEFGQGRYSAAMSELYADSGRLLSLSHGQAVKLAKSFGADLGRQQAVSKIGFGKATKDGKITLKESATMKGVTVTFAISLAKACVLLQEARNYGVTNAEVEIREDMLAWLNE